MLGFLLLYWIGKYYYKLAEAYNKSKWLFTILGIVVYYAGTFVFGFIIGAIMEINSPGYTETVNEFLYGLMMVPFGIISSYLFYDYLKRSWRRVPQEMNFDKEETLQEKSEPVEPA